MKKIRPTKIDGGDGWAGCRILRELTVAALLYGYILIGIIGPSSSPSKLARIHVKVPLSVTHRNQSHDAKANILASRKHFPPANRAKLTAGTILLSNLIPERYDFHLISEVTSNDLPTSASHYTPRPRDPPVS